MSLKPVVKWAGGKRQLLDKITDVMPSDVGLDFALGVNRLYVEPFIGGGALWLDLMPKNAIINDKNEELMNMYRTVRDDYVDVLASIPADSFVYLDPPYMPVSKTASFTGYTVGGFDYAQQVRLRDECVKLRDRGIPFIQSNSDTPAIRQLYKDFTIQTVQARRNIGAKRKTVTELLITA